MYGGLRDRIHEAVDFNTQLNFADFVTFQWCKNRMAFAIYRFVVAIYYFVWVILAAIWASKYLIYLTYWTLTIFTAYLILSAALCIVLSVDRTLDNNSYVRLLLSISWFVYYICATLNPIIVIAFWTLVYPPATALSLFENLTIHFLNGVFIVFNLAVSAQPHKWSHVWVPMLYASVYFIFMVIYCEADGLNENGQPYVYSALNFSNNPVVSALFILGGIFIGIPVIHPILWALTKLRQFICDRCRSCLGTHVSSISPAPPVQRMSIAINDKDNQLRFENYELNE